MTDKSDKLTPNEHKSFQIMIWGLITNGIRPYAGPPETTEREKYAEIEKLFNAMARDLANARKAANDP